MRRLGRRAAGLVRRYRVDRRLPPVVVDTFRTGWHLRTRERRLARRAAIRRPIGATGDASGSLDLLGRLDDRRIVTAAPTNESAYDAALETASWFVDTLERRGVRPFVIDREGGRLRFGVRADQRDAALGALVEAATPGRYVKWVDRNRTGIVALSDAGAARHVKVAREWNIFRATRWGELATGPERGVDVRFFEVGTSHQFEQIGFRANPRFHPATPETTETIGGRRYPGNAAFPVGRGLEYFDGTVHAVYTWVDGADPDWAERCRTTAAEYGRRYDERALDPARFRSRDELRYSLRSLWSHCGWIDHVWLVTAGQRPDWLVEDDRLTVVDHTDIFPESALPTFNSHAIESTLHHIDGLSEHFIYFNDDVFVTRPLAPERFFTSNGLMRVFISDALVPGHEDGYTIDTDLAAMRGRELLDERFRRVIAAKPLHVPFPLRRSVLEAVEREFSDTVDRTRHSRFRSATDVSIAASFAQFYALATGAGVLGDLPCWYVHVESDRLPFELDRVRLGDDLDAFCLNETVDAGGHDPTRDARIQQFFARMYPAPSPWERR